MAVRTLPPDLCLFVQPFACGFPSLSSQIGPYPMTDQPPTFTRPANWASSDAKSGAAPGPFVAAGVLLMAATTIMANATIAPSLPSLRAHYAGVPSIDTLAGLLITLPSLAVVLTAGLVGWLADRFRPAASAARFGAAIHRPAASRGCGWTGWFRCWLGGWCWASVWRG